MRYVVFLILMLTSATPVLAQDAVELSDTQKQFNEKAIEALVAGEPEKAIVQLESAVAIGEANILLLNLGRAYAKAGNCEQAADAYDRAERANVVAAPTPQEVSAILDRYRADLDTQCQTLLIVRCTPANLQLHIGDAPPVTCSDAPVQVTAGPLTVRGTSADREVVETIDIQPNRTNELPLTLEPAVVELPPQDNLLGGPSWTWIAGWTSAGLGVALLGTALILDLAVLGPTIDDLQTAADTGNTSDYNRLKDDASGLQTTNIVLIAAGSVFTVAGVVLLLLPGDEPDSPEAAGLTPWISSNGAGAVWTTRF